MTAGDCFRHDRFRQCFRQLQATLRTQWPELELSSSKDRDILIVPSLSLDQRELCKIQGALHYEERLLCSLIRLRNPRTRLIYVTSQPLPPIVIDYYLQLLPGIPFSHARDRLLLLSTYDGSLRPLTQKILERPRLMEQIRQALRPGRSFMVCYNASPLEEQLSVQLELPLFGADPALLHWGTKSGSRQLFAECGIAHPPGTDLVHSEADLALAIAQLWQHHPQLERMVVKLNEGFSGEGNGLLDLRPLVATQPGSTAECLPLVRQQLTQLRCQAAGETWSSFAPRIAELGAIAEGFIEGERKCSPSVQGYIHPTGAVEILSTHDQILGGPDGQIYLGCTFPAAADYRLTLQAAGVRIGQALAAKGAMERFGVDFVTVQQSDGQWQTQAIEINLRKGGTTHPFLALQYLTQGRYNLADGLFYSAEQPNHPGQAKFYLATDNLHSDRYRGLLPTDLMEIIASHRLHFDSSTKTGSVFHLMGCLSEFGKLGLTCIGNSPEASQAIYQQVIHVLDHECGAPSTTPSPLPMTWRASSWKPT